MSKNENLKLRFKLKELEFEIEGNEKTVKEEFENFKGFVTNDILPQLNKTSDTNKSTELESKKMPIGLDQTEDIESEVVTDFPILKEIVHRDLPKNEQEWILIYAFYASNFGSDTFTRSDIANLYESSNRKTDNTVRHLSRNLKRVLNKGFIKFINDTDYIFKPNGKTQVKLILEGKSVGKSTTSKSSISSSKKEKEKPTKSKSGSKAQGFKLDRSLNLRPENKIGLTDFAVNYKMDSTSARILVVVYYLREILELDNININQIYTGFDKLNIRTPKSLYQLISDTKNKNGWLEFDTMENISLSVQGRNAMKYDLSKSK